MWEITSRHLIKDEKVEYIDIPSLWSRAGSFAWLGLIGFSMLGGLVSATSGKDVAAGIVGLFVMALPAIYLILSTLATKYVITNKRILTRTGIVTDNLKAVPYTHITSVEVRETVFGKMCNYATLSFDTSGSGSEIEQEWPYAKAAFKVRKLLEKHVK